jgi:beta-lactam-binding protein with PASTA domain/serine/threonine protein kinase
VKVQGRSHARLPFADSLYLVASPHLAEQVGRVLDGRYRVVAPIGTGASAAVYLADDTVLRRRVAVKILHAALAGDQGFLKRFQAEAHVAAGLSHPNVMRVIDWGESAESGPFLVLEYLGGGSLRSLLDHGEPLSVEQATHIGLQAARALDYAHRRGLVHRDVKPANLLFDEEGRLAIADFGLARALAEAAWTEPGGSMLGTARYASPEQVRGTSLDGRADVYSLGLVLIEAVTGSVPFTADTVIATLTARLDKHVDIPQEMDILGPVVAAAMHPDPEQRLSSGELVERLEEIAKELPSPERLTLPGALGVTVSSSGDFDETMLPAAGEMSKVSVEARPLPPESPAKKRLVLRRKRRSEDVARLIDGSKSKKRRFRIPLPSPMRVFTTLLVAALLAGAGVGGWLLYYKTGRELTVPVLTDLSTDGARLAAEQADVRIDLQEVFSEDVPPGETIEQDPLPGGKVHTREPVTVKVSKGPAPREVSNVVGQQIDQVRGQFEEKGIVVATEDRYDEVAPKGKIFEQQPADGTVPKGGTVKFIISGGPQPRIVPSVNGMSQDAAVAAITAQQLKVNITEDFNDKVPAGQVAGTKPGAGASVARDSTVSLVISKGPQLVSVPNLSGKSVGAATSTLLGLGLEVTEVRGRPDKPVFDTDPPVGTKVKKGSSIALYTR